MDMGSRPQRCWCRGRLVLYWTWSYHVDFTSGKYKEFTLAKNRTFCRKGLRVWAMISATTILIRGPLFWKDLSSRGWAEIYYSIDSQIAAVDDYIICQNMQNENSKIVFINSDLRVERKDLDELSHLLH